MGDLTMINFVGCFYFLCVAFCVFSYSSMNNETLIAYIPRENSQMTVQEVPPVSRWHVRGCEVSRRHQGLWSRWVWSSWSVSSNLMSTEAVTEAEVGRKAREGVCQLLLLQTKGGEHRNSVLDFLHSPVLAIGALSILKDCLSQDWSIWAVSLGLSHQSDYVPVFIIKQ